MAKVKLNARDMIIEVSDGAPVPTWTEIAGLRNWTYNPSENEEVEDTTTFDDEGNYRQEKMQKGATAEVEGLLLKDHETGEQDPGQAAVEAWHELLGSESEGTLRFRHYLDQEWKVWQATCTLGEQGGETNNKLGWGATFTRCGPSDTVPVAP